MLSNTNEILKRSAGIATLVFGLLIPVCGIVGQDSDEYTIRVVNEFGYPLHIWIMPEDTKKWSQPIPYLPSPGAIRLECKAEGDYYVVARDASGNDDPIGWIPIRKIIELRPNATLIVQGEYNKVQREETVAVQTVRQEQRTSTAQVCKQVAEPQEYTYTVKVIRNGIIVSETRTGTRTVYKTVTENIEKPYTVSVPTTEYRTVLRTVVQPNVRFLVRVDGKDIPISEFSNTNGEK